jgi:hypothetical protein
VQCLGLAQILATTTVLGLGKRLKIVDYPPLTTETVSKVSI